MVKNRKFEELEEKINTYFEICDNANDGQKNIVKPYTLSGLLSYVGISRKEFEKLSRIKRHESIIKRAEAKIEAFIEENMLTGLLSCNASLNSLKYNFGWGEKECADDKADRTITVTLSPEMCELAR